jgi:uncharacterized membrane protein
MIGIIVSLLMALFRFFSDVISKISVDGTEKDKEVNYLTLSVFYRITGIPVLIIAVLIFGIPENLEKEYFLVLFITAPNMVIATILYMKALEISDISVVAPIKSLSPLFTIVTSFFILNELPNIYGLIGIFLILIGIYFIKIEGLEKSIFEPIKRIFYDKGVQYVVIIVILYSFSAPLDKIGVQSSSAAFYSLSLYFFGSMGLVFYHWYSIGKIRDKNHNLKKLSSIGFFNGLSSLTQMIALSLTLVVYVVSIKRVASLLSAIYGAIFLKEGWTIARIVGSVIIIMGSILIALDINIV